MVLTIGWYCAQPTNPLIGIPMTLLSLQYCSDNTILLWGGLNFCSM